MSKQLVNKNAKSNYKASVFPQRKNPVYKYIFQNPVPCFFCVKNGEMIRGRRKKWNSLNKLHGHCSFEHKREDFRDYLINLAIKILSGELK